MTNTTQKPASFTGYQLFLVIILALLQFTIVLDFMIISPLGDVLMKTLHISTSQFGFIVSSYAFSAGASGILAAGFADKFDRKKILLFFYAGFILGTLMCGIANNYYTLLLARIITGLFGGVIGSISLAIVADLFAINQRGRVMGMVQMAFAGSQIIGIPAGIFVANHYGWHATFLMIVIITILIFVAIAFKLSPITEHLKIKSDKNPFLHLWHTLANPRHQTGFLATAFLAIGGFMLMPFSSSFLVNNVHISQKQLPLVFMFTGISSIIIMPLIGKLSDKFNKFILFAIGSIIAVLMVVIYTNMHIVPLWQVIVVNMLLFMGIMSRIIPATTLNTSIPEMQNRGAFMSITSSLQQIAGGLSAILAGFIVHQQSNTSPLEHFDTLGYLVAILILISIWFVYRVNKMIADKK
ncbi:MAG: hypothetical protein RIQ33_2325 [Bacteroidota bacterium]|jgi:predicted MFS family arabinose efflux permease